MLFRNDKQFERYWRTFERYSITIWTLSRHERSPNESFQNKITLYCMLERITLKCSNDFKENNVATMITLAYDIVLEKITLSMYLGPPRMITLLQHNLTFLQVNNPTLLQKNYHVAADIQHSIKEHILILPIKTLLNKYCIIKVLKKSVFPIQILFAIELKLLPLGDKFSCNQQIQKENTHHICKLEIRGIILI